jgi:hypothetical protein
MSSTGMMMILRNCIKIANGLDRRDSVDVQYGSTTNDQIAKCIYSMGANTPITRPSTPIITPPERVHVCTSLHGRAWTNAAGGMSLNFIIRRRDINIRRSASSLRGLVADQIKQRPNAPSQLCCAFTNLAGG